MKVLIAALVVLLLGLQYRLWFGDGSVQEVWRLRQDARETHTELIRLRGRNQALEAEVADLKSGLDAIEERARAELGMVDPDETFYQFVREQSTRSTVNTRNNAVNINRGNGNQQ
jgi:cell division protein FtsB